MARRNQSMSNKEKNQLNEVPQKGIAHNYGSGLASAFLLKQTINTGYRSGDFHRDITHDEKHSVGTYLRSLTQDKP